MPSRLGEIKAHDFRPTGGTAELWETVIRRIGGQPDRTEDVQAVVDFDTEGGGLAQDQNGKAIEIVGRLEIAATQAATDSDSWVIQDGPFAGVYRAAGLPTSGDGGTKTVNLVKRIGRIATQPRTRGR
jgi:hypothetical protein